MTEEQIIADLEAFDKEPTPEVKGTSAQKALISPADTQTDKGEVPAEQTGGIEDAGKDKDASAGTEPESKEEAGRARDPETGKFVKKGEEPPPAAEEISGKAEEITQKAEDSPPKETKYERAKKEQDRQKSLLAGFDEEKARARAEIAAEKQRIAEEKARLEEERLRVRQERNGQRPTDENGNPIYSSYELRQLAKDYRRRALKGEEGPNGENYGEISERAEVEAERAAAREAKEQQERFERRQTALAMETMTAHPDLADENSPLQQEIKAVFAQEAEMSRLYGRPSVFRQIEDGFPMAVEVAKLRLKAADSDKKDTRISELEAEVDRLTKLTSLGSSSPVQARQPKPREQMTADELLDDMDKEAEKQGAKIWKR
jgi:hypothetical protein